MGAAENCFSPGVVSDVDFDHLKIVYQVSKPFVMYTGGIDHRKNIEGLIEAYANLPIVIRSKYQLVIVCSIEDSVCNHVKLFAKNKGLEKDELILTRYVSDQDLLLFYRACRLFVFPSWHEGFALPVLEAMQCGKAVIASNTTSLPEIVGCEDALFNPHDISSITKKIQEVLTNDVFRTKLEYHGLAQSKKFSWDESARRGWSALTSSYKNLSKAAVVASPKKLPRLAYFSPLPPEASGISDYSAELLPELVRYYEIDVILTQEKVSNPWIQKNCSIRNVAWFKEHAYEFDRILYHMGNSYFHSHMFDLLKEYSGVVILHDFFLSGVVWHRDISGEERHYWPNILMKKHGWKALAARYQSEDTDDVVLKYPCNLEVLQNSLAIIVHSEHSRELAKKWYGNEATDNWAIIPLLRRHREVLENRKKIRHEFGLPENAFIIGSFGIIGPTKLNDRLLDAWLASSLVRDLDCYLIFVGGGAGSYYETLKEKIKKFSNKRIRVTGRVDDVDFHRWLEIANVGVQLRADSRGETSAAALDCMSYGLSTIVNAHGSMSELPENSVWMLPDNFDNSMLSEALVALRNDPKHQEELGQRALSVIINQHDPKNCAQQYFDVIENFYKKNDKGELGHTKLLQSLAALKHKFSIVEKKQLAKTISKNIPPYPRNRQLLVDISALAKTDLKTGIERVVRAILNKFLSTPLAGWVVQPVYAKNNTNNYFYARSFTSEFLGVDADWAIDEVVEAWSGDVFFGLDLSLVITVEQKKILKNWHHKGVNIRFLIYDLLPIQLPEYFPDYCVDSYQRWIEMISCFNGAICISKAVTNDFQNWIKKYRTSGTGYFHVDTCHLGADIKTSIPTTGISNQEKSVLNALKNQIAFLMVATLEPRKGHLQTIKAFELLWKKRIEISLVIVGKKGWMVDYLIGYLKIHPELKKRLFWLEAISDECLELVYQTSDCLIAASEGEGFGLPLIEAAQHALPIVARDIPVFREVLGNHAFYFADTKEPAVLAKAIEDWLLLNKEGSAPQSKDMPYLTWEKSAEKMLNILINKDKKEQKLFEEEIL